MINGQGAARPQLEADAADLANVRFGDHQPAGRLNEVLATGDVHVVPLRRGLGRVSVPSKIYSILAAGRPVVAAIDTDSEVSRIVTTTGCGIVVAPDDTEAFIAGIRSVLGTEDLGAGMGRAGRAWVEKSASPQRDGGRLRGARAGAGGPRRMSSDPPRHRRGAPVALRPRGSLIVVDQKGRPARPEGQGQEGQIPGRDTVPAHRRDRAGGRHRHDRVRPPDRAGRRLLAADDRRPLARRVRVLPV